MADDTRLIERARSRHWVLATADLADLGLTREAIRHRVRRGTLHPKHPGVYAVGRPQLGPEGTWLAATLACHGSVLSHHSAAALLGLLPAGSGRPHVTVGTQAGRFPRRDVVVHRCESLTPAQVMWRAGIPVTTLPRTLRDLAGPLQPAALTRAVRQAVVVHRLDLAPLRVALELAPPNAARERRLLKVVQHYVPGDVGIGFEEALLAVIVRADVPTPQTQYPIAGYRMDFAWPDLRLAIEADDRRSHDTDVGFADDRVKDRRMRAIDWDVERFTYAEVTQQASAVAREIHAIIARRRRQLGQ